jgi:hypothetical protein
LGASWRHATDLVNGVDGPRGDWRLFAPKHVRILLVVYKREAVQSKESIGGGSDGGWHCVVTGPCSVFSTTEHFLETKN